MRKVLRICVFLCVLMTIFAASIPLYTHNPALDQSPFPEVGTFVEEHVTFLNIDHLRAVRDWLKALPERF